MDALLFYTPPFLKFVINASKAEVVEDIKARCLDQLQI